MVSSHETLEWADPTNDATDTGDRLSTGIEILDRKLGGGIPAGRTVLLSASPVSQSELFLYEMAGARDTMYLTSERTVEDVEISLARYDDESNHTTVHHIDASDPIGDAREKLSELTDASTLIVDPMGPLEEANEREYRTFLNELKTRTHETRSLSVLHCLDGRQVPAQRDRTEYLSDVIFNLVTRLRGGSVENSLTVPKFRGGAARTDAIQLDLTTNVTIDVSRKIA